MTVRVVTDSNTMIPPDLAAALGITVVPLTVTIGGDELVEDGNLDIADAYRRLRAGEPATTSAPAPGAFAAVYASLAPDPIVSVHIGAGYSGTLNAAQLGAQLSGLAVRLVDTGTVSFLAGCCVLAAAEAAATGSDAGDVAWEAEDAATRVASVFTIAEVDRVAAGGRLDVGPEPPADGTPVLLMRGAEVVTLQSVTSAEAAADVMYDHMVVIGGPLRIGVGDADAGPVVDELFVRLRAARPDDELIRYVVGPTVAAHAGMGTFGVVYHHLRANDA